MVINKHFINIDLGHLSLVLEDVIEKFYGQSSLDEDDMNMVLGLMFISRSLYLYIQGLELKK